MTVRDGGVAGFDQSQAAAAAALRRTRKVIVQFVDCADCGELHDTLVVNGGLGDAIETLLVIRERLDILVGELSALAE